MLIITANDHFIEPQVRSRAAPVTAAPENRHHRLTRRHTTKFEGKLSLTIICYDSDRREEVEAYPAATSSPQPARWLGSVITAMLD